MADTIEVEWFIVDGSRCWMVTTNETHDCTCSYPAGYERRNYPVPALRRRVNYASLWSVLRWIGYLPSGAKHF